MADKQTVKVGDRITAKFDDSCNDYRAGNTFYVQEIDEQDGEMIVIFTDNVGDKRYRRVSEFTVEHAPVAGATGKASCAIEEGDRVRVLSDYLPWASADEIGTVQNANARDRDCFVKFETERMGDHNWYVRWDNLELAPSLNIETGKFYRTRDGRKVGPMKRYNDGWLNESDGHGRMWRDDGLRYYEESRGDGSDLIAEWVDEPAGNANAPATTPAIVALIEGGQPKPSEQPKVHKSEQAATDEAERLAVKYPGQKFGVFVLADSRIADVVIRRAA
ncbi:hypothetical protein JAU75_19555 [Ochrobactrum sp. Q0168]|uniref:hypothetical protein n=1 Tax=Ochrobactrum sp. Q0168 TaxID=2793241 RepID=UPI0018EB52C6|nr:hypothetical protein [Ochrobactrum sp. Q0168]